MAGKGSKAKTAAGAGPKKREDRSIQGKVAFPPATVEARTANSVILILQTDEEFVIVQALLTLDKFAMRSKENLITLMENNILPHLLKLIYHSDLYIRRFSNKLMGQLCCLPEIQAVLLQNTEHLLYFTKEYITESDLVIQEFSSLSLAEMTTLHAVSVMILETDIADTLFLRLQSPDPDIQKNSEQIMMNLLANPLAGDLLVKCKNFSFVPLITLFNSIYPVIQNLALDIVEFMTRRQDAQLLQLFRKAMGLERCLDLLQMFDWKDLHPSVFKVLRNIVEDPENAEYIQTSGCVNILIHYMDDIQDNRLIEDTLSVILKLAKLKSGREMLYDNDIVDILMIYLRNESSDLAQAACLSLAHMTLHKKAREAIVLDYPVREITAIMKSESRSWENRQAAAYSLWLMMTNDKRFCLGLLHSQREEVLLATLWHTVDKFPAEILNLVVDCYSVLAMHDDILSQIINYDLIAAMTQHLKNTDPSTLKLRISICMCLSRFCSERVTMNHFHKAKGALQLKTCLMDCNMQLRSAAASLLQLMASNKKLVAAFQHFGILHWMVEQNAMRFVCPAWETAIEAIFNNALSAKFAYKRRLETHNITEDCFYVTREIELQFPILEDLLSIRASPIRPIYVVNFKCKEEEVEEVPERLHSTPMTPEEEQLEKLLKQFGCCALDPYLQIYLEQVMKLIEKHTEETGACAIGEKTKILGNFVYEQMCGPAPDMPCDRHLDDLHLQELKVQLQTNVIPLGHVRVGIFLERALLFKVLADRLSIPCALVRGDYSRAWVEVPIPEASLPEEEDPIAVERLPIDTLKPNYIVDLMSRPVRLLLIGSMDADGYCNKRA